MRYVAILLSFGISSAALAAPVLEAKPEAFPFDWSQLADSKIDLRRFLDAPAGKAGHVGVKGETFVTGDGKEIRFWGVNLAIDICFPPKDKAAYIADGLARWGVNLVRFHHIDTDWGNSFIAKNKDTTQELDAENLDRFDNLFAELKKRGIWMVITMNIHRKYRSGDGVRDWKLLGIGKAATYFNPRLIELQHTFSRKVLGHRNPYTGLTYAEDPAIMAIELLNENSLMEAWMGWRIKPGVTERGNNPTWQPIPDSYSKELDALYYDWLVEKGTPEQRAALEKEAGIKFDKRPAKIPHWIRLTPNLFAKASKVRFAAEAQFLMEMEAEFFDNYKKLIRDEMGSKALLTLSNDHADRFSGYAHLTANMRGDWIDSHGYWEHPLIGKITAVQNTPMVNVPLNSTVVQSGRSAVVGRPFTIGEVNHPFPHRYAVEGFPILTAYSMMHGWDGIAWFNWEKGCIESKDIGIRRNGWFDLSTDPVKLAQLATCGLMWHRGDVTESQEVHLRKYGAEEIIESLRLTDEQPYFKPGFDLSMAIKKKVQFTFDENAEVSPLGAEGTPRKIYDRSPAKMDSATGELSWSNAHVEKGIVKIDTARTCGLIGFVKEHWGKEEATTRHLVAKPTNPHCSLLLTSLDDGAIAESAQLLLTATVRSLNTGQTWHDNFQTLAEWGTGPTQIIPFRGEVLLKNLGEASAVTLYALSPEGRRVGEGSAATATEDGWSFVPEKATTWWEIAVTR